MAKRLKHEKKYTPYQTTQIGENDDAPTPLWQIRKQVRERLCRQYPHSSNAEIEQRVNRIVARGMRPAAWPLDVSDNRHRHDVDLATTSKDMMGDRTANCAPWERGVRSPLGDYDVKERGRIMTNAVRITPPPDRPHY